MGVKLDDRRKTWSVVKGWKKMQGALRKEEEESARKASSRNAAAVVAPVGARQ